jgi:glycosyltransferase involved in cell wall biosynthesis
MKQNTAVICLSPINGGMELASIKIARLLSKDVNISFIAKSGGYISTQKQIFDSSDIKLYTVSFLSNFSFSLIFNIRNILIKNNINNVIFLGASEMKSLYFAALGLNVNFIVRQGTTKSTPKKDFFHRLIYSNVSYFVGNSEYIVKNIWKILPVSNNAVVKKIYASVQLDEKINYKNYDDCLDLIHVGRITKGKGQLEAVKACSILKENNINFRLRLIGSVHDKDYFNVINEYLNKCDYKANIEFIGFCSNVKEYYEKSDIFIFPTYGEGMSNAIIEAISFGLIPIIYNNTSTPEFKDLGFYIHLTEQNDMENLRKNLINVASDIYNEKLKAQSNHNKALEVFSINREKNEYMGILA